MDTFDPAFPSGNTLNRFHETSARFQRYKVLLRRRWWFLLLTAAIAVCFQALRITGKDTEYKSLGRIVVGMQVQLGDKGATFENRFLEEFYGTQIDMLESGKVRGAALDRVKVLHPDLTPADVEVRVSQTKGSSILNVEGISPEREYTKIYLEAVLVEYMNLRKELFKNSVNDTVEQVMAEIKDRDQKVIDAKAKYEQFLKENDQALFNESRSLAAVYLARLKSDLSSLETEKAFMENLGRDDFLRQKSQNGVGVGASVTAIPSASDATGSRLGATTGLVSGGISRIEADYLDSQTQLRSLEGERERLLAGNLLKDHPSVKLIESKIDAQNTLIKTLTEQAKDEWDRRLKSLELRTKTLKDEIAVRDLEAKAANEKQVAHMALEGDYKRMLEDQATWRKKLEDLSAAGLAVGEPVNIMQHATDAVQHQPELLVPLLIGLICGLVAGAVILLLFDRLDDRMNSFSEFQALFPNEAILGQIPEQNSRGDVTLIRPNDDRHLYAESFRNLRSSILFKNWRGGKPPKVILVTSAVPNEGKTTTVANMAVTMALGGARVLLVDADLRRGGINELFKIQVSPGFSDVLSSKIHWRDAVQDTSTKGLHVLPRGEALDQTSELFLSPLATELLKEMGEEYDYVIFDSAPVLVADDTSSFAPKVDTVLFVVRMSSTMARLSAKALDLLYDRQVSVGGVILNRSSTNLKEYTYYNYASYYSVGTQKGDSKS